VRRGPGDHGPARGHHLAIHELAWEQASLEEAFMEMAHFRAVRGWSFPGLILARCAGKTGILPWTSGCLRRLTAALRRC
jgi:hypothetical protein